MANMEMSWLQIGMAFAFFIGYLAIIFEHYIKVNKTASALLMAVITWVLLFFERKEFGVELLGFSILNRHLGNVSQIIFFLLGAMTLVELIDVHKGFKFITDMIKTHSKKKILWSIGIIAFFLSSVLDNLTTTIIMISIIRKIADNYKDRAILGSAVVIAANAGGAWTPIGDVTTTMLWIKGNLTAFSIIKYLFLPSVVVLVVALFLLSFQMKGTYKGLVHKGDEKLEPGAKIVFFCGVGALIFVPIFKSITGLPPFMGILIGVAILWLITDLMHYKDDSKEYLRIPYVLGKIDTSAVLFFLGILLCISSLEIAGLLKKVAFLLNEWIADMHIVAVIIGLLSAIVDNVPLVAACIGMYPIHTYPPDTSLWLMIAYCAGTGGSILIIGSAAGIALMGLEKIDFIWYVKKISLVALVSYVMGAATYLLLFR